MGVREKEGVGVGEEGVRWGRREGCLSLFYMFWSGCSILDALRARVFLQKQPANGLPH